MTNEMWFFLLQLPMTKIQNPIEEMPESQVKKWLSWNFLF